MNMNKTAKLVSAVLGLALVMTLAAWSTAPAAPAPKTVRHEGSIAGWWIGNDGSVALRIQAEYIADPGCGGCRDDEKEANTNQQRNSYRYKTNGPTKGYIFFFT